MQMEQARKVCELVILPILYNHPFLNNIETLALRSLSDNRRYLLHL